MRYLCWLAVALVMSATVAQAAAEKAAPPKPLSMADAVALALRENPDLNAVREELPAALARLRVAEAKGKLTGSATGLLSTGTEANMLMAPGGVMPRASRMEPGQDNADLNGYLLYPLYTGGRVEARTGEAGAKVRGTKADIETMILNVAYGARAAYWKVLLRREILKVQQDNLAKAQERLRIDKVAETAGKIPLYYVLRDKADVADAQQAVTNATRDEGTAMLALRVVLGMPSTAEVKLTDKLVYVPNPPVIDEAAEVATALKQRPEPQARKAAVEAAQREVRARRASYQPQVNAMLLADGVASSGSSGGGYTLGVVASLPILDGGARSAGVAEAEAMLKRAQQEERSVDLKVEQQVRTAILDVKAAEQNVRTAAEAEASAREDYRVALIRYKAGKAINLEPISALAALVKAETNLAQALYEHDLARDEVGRAEGRVP